MKFALLAPIAALLLTITVLPPCKAQVQQKALRTGPILYGILPDGQLYKIDVMNCTACLIANLNAIPGNGLDLLVLPNGDILVQSDGLKRYTLPNPNPIWTFGSATYEGSILAPDGTVYLSQIWPTTGLSTYDPVTNNVVFIGAWPAGIVITEFFYQNGVLYGFGGLNNMGIVVQINTTDPGQSTIVQSGLPITAYGTTNDGYTNTFSTVSPTILNQYNVNTNTLEFICELSAFTMGAGFTGLTDLPPGVQEAPCICVTFAGSVNNQTFNPCLPGNVTVPYNNNATLAGNDILRFILFSNPSDTLGSIIVQSGSPTIAFNPATMQTGVTYYLATLAGDNLNGNVDINDPCLDISNIAAQVIWREKPNVTFTVANPNVCAGGCTTITATFTGAPPFTLSYSTPGNGTQTQTFSGNTGTFQVCLPANAAPGSFQLTATSLVDAWCSCN
ncbi:MAG: hypothetical protein ACOYPR_18735 [Saprospiraceae bacterium]